jgi:hypothetical protein
LQIAVTGRVVRRELGCCVSAVDHGIPAVAGVNGANGANGTVVAATLLWTHEKSAAAESDGVVLVMQRIDD